MRIATLNTTIGLIEYSIQGRGYPTLILHGGHSNAKETLFHKNLNQKKLTLITPSRPGYGNTPLLDNKTPIKAAKQIIELMDKLEFNKFNVLGVSAGGLTAIAIASQYPERVNKLVLPSAVTKRWVTPEDQLYKRGKKLFNPGIGKLTWALMKFFLRLFPRMIIRKMASELSTEKIIHITDEEVNDMKSLLLNSRSGSGFITDLEHDLEEQIIEEIKVPTLIVHSKNDNSVSQEHPLHAKDKIENSRLIWIDNNWGHMIFFDKKAMDSINTFLLNDTIEPVPDNV